MRIFISYASEKRDLAEAIAIELRAQGNQVFLDKDDLPAGLAYDEQIRLAILKSDMMIFLVSSESVEAGRYTLTELSVAKQKWSSPQGKVLPVIVESVDHANIPAYLKSVTFLEPVGDLVSDVVHAINLMHTRWGRLRLLKIAAIFLLVLILVLVGSYFVGKANKERVVTIIKEDNLSDMRFTVIGGDSYAQWGSSHTISLQLNSGSLGEYECRVEKSVRSNVKNISHDKNCSEITVEMNDGPFVHENGLALDGGDHKEVLKITVFRNGKDVWSGLTAVGLLSIIHPYDFELLGVETERKSKDLQIKFGEVYYVALMYKGKLLGQKFECEFIDTASPTLASGGGPVIDLKFDGGGCSGKLISVWKRIKRVRSAGSKYDQQLVIYDHPTDVPEREKKSLVPQFARFSIIITHSESKFKANSMFRSYVTAEIAQ